MSFWKNLISRVERRIDEVVPEQKKESVPTTQPKEPPHLSSPAEIPVDLDAKPTETKSSFGGFLSGMKATTQSLVRKTGESLSGLSEVFLA